MWLAHHIGQRLPVAYTVRQSCCSMWGAGQAVGMARLRSSAASGDADSRCLPQALQPVSSSSAPVPGQSGQVQALGSGLGVRKLIRLLQHGMLKAEWLAAGCREGLLLPDVLGRPSGELRLPVCVTCRRHQFTQWQGDLTAPCCVLQTCTGLHCLGCSLCTQGRGACSPGRRCWGPAGVSSTSLLSLH